MSPRPSQPIYTHFYFKGPHALPWEEPGLVGKDASEQIQNIYRRYVRLYDSRSRDALEAILFRYLVVSVAMADLRDSEGYGDDFNLTGLRAAIQQ
jgi:hypothetical protein